MNDGYQGSGKVDSAVLDEPNRVWFCVSEEPFASEVAAQMAVQDAIYRLGVRLRKVTQHPSHHIIIEKA